MDAELVKITNEVINTLTIEVDALDEEQDNKASSILDYFLQPKDIILQRWIANEAVTRYFIPIRITKIISPTNFWFYFVDSHTKDNLESFTVKMNEAYNAFDKSNVNVSVSPKKLHKNYFGAINFEGNIHRIRVDNLYFANNMLTVDVFHVDYGFTTKGVPYNNCLLLLKPFSYKPQQAIRGACAFIVPNKDKQTWDPDITELFINLVKNKQMFCRIMITNENNLTVYVLLRQQNVFDQEISINDFLIAIGLAAITQHIDPTTNNFSFL